MKTRTTITLCLSLAASVSTAPVSAQSLETRSGLETTTQPVARPEQQGSAVPLRALSQADRLRLEARDSCFDAERWRARLSDPDLDRRERAFQELVPEAARCAKAIAALETWAASMREPELSWTARLLLRELRNQPRTLVLSLPRGPVAGLGSAIRFELADPSRVGAQLELLQGPLQDLFQSGSELSLYAPRRVLFEGPPAAIERQRSFSVEAGPERVTLRISERIAGEERMREFSAASLAELLAEHPELGQEVPGLADMVVQPLGRGPHSMRWSTGPVRLRFDPYGLHEKPGDAPVLGLGADGDPPSIVKLGIECREATPEERRERSLEPGLGLRVERVELGTVAHLVELRRGDVLLQIDGVELRVCDDITRALAEREPDQPLVLRLVDTSSQRRTITWNPR